MRSFKIILFGFFFISLSSLAYGQCSFIPDGELTANFLSIPALAAFVIVATSFVRNLSWLKKINPQYVSWGMSILLALIGWFLQIGIFVQLEWYYIFIYGLASGLIANGLYDWEVIKAVLSILELKTGEEK